MEYTRDKLARLAGVTKRTLRFYDQCGLLKPGGIRANGYRIYGQAEVDRLQQILLYREMDVPIEEIGRILDDPAFDPAAALADHLTALEEKHARLEMAIANVKRTLHAMEGGLEMKDQEKFEGLGQRLVRENEERYGAEIREKYGEDAVSRSNQKVSGMTEEQLEEVGEICRRMEQRLKIACAEGDPASSLAQEVCDLHRQWLRFFHDGYCREYHLALGEMYVEDPRFTAYYEKIGPGCAVFLRDAIRVYCEA